MTAVSASVPAPDLSATALSGCIRRLEDAIDAASRLGLDTSAARGVRELAAARLRFPGSTYVLALAGGTGVGKSNILNRLAGAAVTRSSVRRPTTSEPVAWIPAAARAEIAPLLDWLGVRETREHADPRLAGVAILDLPDLDSIAAAHRERVDALLPRVDAVLWVADPEKYHDAVLHDAYVRTWGPRLDRQAVVLNKTDLLAPDDAERLRRDLSERLRREGLPSVPVLLAGAPLPGASSVRGGGDGDRELRDWLGSDVEAKLVVAGRVRAELRAAVEGFARDAGLGASPAGEHLAPTVSQTRRRQAVAEVTREVLGLVDLAGVERQAVTATRHAARPRGAGPIGRIRNRLRPLDPRTTVTDDPAAYLRRWRERGRLVRGVEPLRRLVADTLPQLTPATRPAFVTVAEPNAVQARVIAAVDSVIAAEERSFHPPTSRLWWLVGAGQLLTTAAFLLAIVWLVVLWLAPATDVNTFPVPVLGPVPLPALLLVGSLVAGFLLSRLLDAHASYLGRRWARGIGDRLSAGIGQALAASALAPLDALEAARTQLAAAAASVERDCR